MSDKGNDVGVITYFPPSKDIQTILDIHADTNQRISLLEQSVALYRLNNALQPKLPPGFQQALCTHIIEHFNVAEREQSVQLRCLLIELLRISLRVRTPLPANFEDTIVGPMAKLLFSLAGFDFSSFFASAILTPAELCEIVIEAEKCLVNLTFNSAKTREIFRNKFSDVLVERLSICYHLLAECDEEGTAEGNANILNVMKIVASVGRLAELHHYDIKLSFLQTALTPAIRGEWLTNHRLTDIFLSNLQFYRLALFHTISADKQQNTEERVSQLVQGSMPWLIINEVLRTSFNLFHRAKFLDLAVAKRFSDECVAMLCNAFVDENNFGNGMVTLRLDKETVQNIINLLSVMPIDTVASYCQELDTETNERLMQQGLTMENRDMRFVAALLAAFERAIAQMPDGLPAEMLSTHLTILCELCTVVKEARRYCRIRILPPLTDVEVARRPDEGQSLRNKVIRLMMMTGNINELASELMFILCKRSVDRMMKYCGFGHAAGLLANYGFLSRAMSSGGEHASDSEDSETDAYRLVEDRVDPITGHIPDPKIAENYKKMLAEMSEEQKEHEVMKLVNCMDRLMDQGLVCPGTIGKDGRPQAVSHVCELLKEADSTMENKKKRDSSEDDD